MTIIYCPFIGQNPYATVVITDERADANWTTTSGVILDIEGFEYGS